MSKFLKTKTKKFGMSPGSLIYVGEIDTDKIHLSAIDYNEKQYIEKKDASLAECLQYLNTPSVTWINICGIHDSKTVEALGRHFGLHPLLLEDIMSTGQRSKLDNYKDNLFIVVRMLKYSEEKHEVQDEQISLVLGNNYLISFLESSQDIFESVRDRLRNSKSRIRQRGADYLAYSLIDCIVDHYFVILEKVDEKLESVEDELFTNPTKTTMQKIYRNKRDVALLRKAVWPMREVLSHFRRMETPLIQDATKLYIQDVYDHTIQTIDTIESFRDIAAGMLDIYLSDLSQRMNEIMKVLTIVATIFVPLTFVASLYGMNFEYIPELHWKYGYFYVLVLMVVISLSMLYYFRRKRWL